MDALMDCKADPYVQTREWYDTWCNGNKHHFVRVPSGSTAVDIWKIVWPKSPQQASVYSKLVDYRIKWTDPMSVRQWVYRYNCGCDLPAFKVTRIVITFFARLESCP